MVSYKTRLTHTYPPPSTLLPFPLTARVDVSTVHPDMLENGWKFAIPGGKVPEEDFENATEDKLFGSKYIKEVYFKADPGVCVCGGVRAGQVRRLIFDVLCMRCGTEYNARFTGRSMDGVRTADAAIRC